MSVSASDPRYLSGELVSITTGRTFSEKTKEILSKKMSTRQLEKNTMHGKIWINDGKNSKGINIQDLNTWETSGWKKGRLINKFWINNGKTDLFINSSDFINYDQTLWNRGKAKKI